MMGQKLTFDQLRLANVERCIESYRQPDSWAPSQWLVGVVEEVGEIARIIYREQAGKIDGTLARKLIAEELADVITYLDLLAARMGVDLGEAVRAKFNLVSERVGSEIKL